MSDHAQRAHATWSASATARNWNCAGALALGAKVEHLDIESEAAAWGTACHQVAEKCLRQTIPADHLIGTEEKTKAHTFDVDEEMAECAQVYVDYVSDKAGVFGPAPNLNKLYIEKRFSLAKLNPPFDAGGTCDAIIYNPDEKLLEVVDLKGGRGVVVEVTENKQLRTYALGALLANPGLDVMRVRSTIVQPRAPHKDGRIRSETYHVADLIEWTVELLERMHSAKRAEEALANVRGELSREAWGEHYLVAGDHCKFCPAASICPALERKALDVAKAFFNDGGKLEIRNQPDEMDPAVLARTLDGLDMLQEWMNAKRALALRLAESGVEIYDPTSGSRYQLVDKVGHRKFIKGDDVVDDLAELGLTQGDIFEEKVRTPAKIEKALGAKRLKAIKADFDALIHKPVTGRSLVSSAKTSKPAVKSKAEAFFS